MILGGEGGIPLKVLRPVARMGGGLFPDTYIRKAPPPRRAKHLKLN